MQWLIVVAMVAAVIGFVLYRLARSNLDVPPTVENPHERRFLI